MGRGVAAPAANPCRSASPQRSSTAWLPPVTRLTVGGGQPRGLPRSVDRCTAANGLRACGEGCKRVGWRGRAGSGLWLAAWASRAGCAGFPRCSSVWEGGGRGELCSRMSAPGQPAARFVAHRACSLLTACSAGGEAYHMNAQRYEREDGGHFGSYPPRACRAMRSAAPPPTARTPAETTCGAVAHVRVSLRDPLKPGTAFYAYIRRIGCACAACQTRRATPAVLTSQRQRQGDLRRPR